MRYFFILFILCAMQSKAQNTADSVSLNLSIAKPKLDTKELFRVFAIKSMINAINFDKLIKAPSGFAQIGSIVMIFNEYGNIDSVIVNFKPNQYFELKKNPAIELKTFKPILGYANSTVILPILYIRQNELDINLKNSFLEAFSNLFHSNLLNKKMNLVLLKPEINPFSQVK